MANGIGFWRRLPFFPPKAEVTSSNLVGRATVLVIFNTRPQNGSARRPRNVRAIASRRVRAPSRRLPSMTARPTFGARPLLA
jgi:hypothetical protein